MPKKSPNMSKMFASINLILYLIYINLCKSSNLGKDLSESANIHAFSMYNAVDNDYVYMFHDYYKKLGVSNFTIYFNGSISANPRVQCAKNIFIKNADNVRFIDWDDQTIKRPIPLTRLDAIKSFFPSYSGWILMFNLKDYLVSKESIVSIIEEAALDETKVIYFKTTIAYTIPKSDIISYDNLLDYQFKKHSSHSEKIGLKSYAFNARYGNISSEKSLSSSNAFSAKNGYITISKKHILRILFKDSGTNANYSSPTTLRHLLKIPDVNISSTPFYYFAPKTEGLGARWGQLKYVANEVITVNKRPLVLVSYFDVLHSPDSSFHGLINYCKYFQLPPGISCSKEIPELLVNRLPSDACKLEYSCKNNYVDNQDRYIGTYASIKSSRSSINKSIRIVKKIDFRNDRFVKIMIIFPPMILGSKLLHRCGLVYAYGKQLDFPIKFTSERELIFDNIMFQLEAAYKTSFRNLTVVHYRRGDKAVKCAKNETWSYCQLINKYGNVNTLLDAIKKASNKDNKVLISTDESDQQKLAYFVKNNVYTTVSLMEKISLIMSSLETLFFELQLFIYADSAILIKDTSALDYMIVQARNEQNKSTTWLN